MSAGESAVYYPEDLALFGEILDQVMQSLPPDLHTPDNRAAFARSIFACAASGERDPDALRHAASMDLDISAAA